MVFISIQGSLEKFLDKDIKTRFKNLDWFLFDAHIKDRSLKDKCNFFGVNTGNLRAYMDRMFYYPAYYDVPVYAYLLTEKYFQTLHFLPEEYENISSIINMKRVPKFLGEDNGYTRIPNEKWIYGGEGYDSHKQYLKRQFKLLAEQTNQDISYVILDGK